MFYYCKSCAILQVIDFMALIDLAGSGACVRGHTHVLEETLDRLLPLTVKLQ
jgi:hypothetical protein